MLDTYCFVAALKNRIRASDGVALVVNFCGHCLHGMHDMDGLRRILDFNEAVLRVCELSQRYTFANDEDKIQHAEVLYRNQF